MLLIVSDIYYLATFSKGFTSNGDESSLPRVHALLGNLLLERARTAPKMIIPDPRESTARSAPWIETY